MNNLYTRALLVSFVGIHMLSMTYADPVSCDSEIFKKNSCDICVEWGEISVSNKDFTFPETIIPWENKSDNFNHNIYKASQNSAEIITEIGTVEENWHETAIVWAEGFIWTKFAGVDKYILASKQKIDFRKINKDTVVPLSNFKTSTNPIVLKVPIKYHEIETGSFTQWAEKTSNYCISYTPKISATTSTATTTPTPPVTTTTATTTTPTPTTTTTPAPTTTTPTTPVAPIPKPTTVANPPATTTTPPSATTTAVTTKPPVTPATNTTTPTTTTTTTTIPAVTTPTTTTTTSAISPKPPIANTQTTGIVPTSTSTNTAIPAYNPSVPLNSAGNDPKLSAASKVASGPAENMYIFMAAVVLSAVLYPKMRKMSNKI